MKSARHQKMFRVRVAIGCAVVAVITTVAALFMDYYKTLNKETLLRAEAVNARDLIVHDLMLRMNALDRLGNRLAESDMVDESEFAKEADIHLDDLAGYEFVSWLSPDGGFEYTRPDVNLPIVGRQIDPSDVVRTRLLAAVKGSTAVEFSKPTQGVGDSRQGFAVARSVWRDDIHIGTIWLEFTAADWIENLHFSGSGHMMHQVLLEVYLDGKPIYATSGFAASDAKSIAAPKMGMGHDAVTVRVKETHAYHDGIHNPLGIIIVAFVAVLSTTAVVAVFALLSSRRQERRATAAIATLTQTNDRMQEEVKHRRLAEQEAKRSNAAKSQFLSVMSHEIRTPMNGILGMSELLHDSGLNQDQSGYVSAIQTSSAALMTLICDILDFSKFEHGEIELRLEPCNIHDLLSDTIDILRPTAEKAGLDLKFDVDRRTPAVFSVDRQRLRQIVLNLTNNALKFTVTGGVHISLMTPAEPNSPTVLKVRDTGIGIPDSKIEEIFDGFAQVEADAARAFDGSGLGLSIVDRVVKAMDGSISVASKLGEGSEFTVTLPLQTAQAEQPAAQVAQVATNDTLKQARILLAEDNGINQRIVSKFLTGQIAALEIANNGHEAIQRFEEGAYDLVLMDVSMPGKNGFDAARSIRQLQGAHPEKTCPIIAYTANAGAEDQRKCFDAGMDDVLPKPTSKNEILSRLRYWLQAPNQREA